MLLGGRRQPQHRPEAARIVVAKQGAVVEHDVDVVVLDAGGRRSGVDAEAAGHPEVNQHPIGAESQQ